MRSPERPDDVPLALGSTRDFAIVTLDLEGRIRGWSSGAEEIVGYGEEEILGQPLDVLFREEDRAAGAPQRELERTLAKGRAEDVRWQVGKGGVQFFADGVTTLVIDPAGRPTGFTKIFRDVTERHLTERRLATQLALTTLFSEELEFSTIAKSVMRNVCESLGWEVGELWTVSAKKDEISCEEFWHAESFDGKAAESFCGTSPFKRGLGLPGRVWATGRPHWIPELEADTNFRRSKLAAEHGLRSGLAFPIIRRGEVTDVLEFFSLRFQQEDSDLIDLLGPAGAQIGDYIERRRTENDLRESEKRYRVITETAQDAIVTIDESSTILFANQTVERLLGWSPEELVGRRLDILMPERYRASHDGGIGRYIRTGAKRIPWRGVELPGLHRDGHEVPLEISFGESQREGKRIFSGFMRDISERKRAQKEVQELLVAEQQAREEAERANSELERRAEEESSFRHLASALTGAVDVDEVLGEITRRATIVTRADGAYVERIISADGEVEVRAANGRRTPPTGLRVPYPGSLTEEILETRSPAILADMDNVGAAMAPYLRESCGDCELLVVPLVTVDEALGALVLLNSAGRRFHETDVTRAKTLGDLTSLALRRVRMMDTERRARTTAEEAVRSRERTLGIVSHDLRNPLTKISLAAQLLRASPSEDPSEQVAIILSATQQMERLIADLLDAARIELHGLKIHPEPTELGPIIDQACSSNRMIAAQRRQSIECRLEDDLPPVRADRDRILQVLNNLIGNAIKFTPEDGTIEISGRRDDGFVVVSVSDSGPGVPPGREQEIFDSRWQAPETAHLGAGLGLSIVKGIVEAHGGRVEAGNGAAGGAVLSFTIPLAD